MKTCRFWKKNSNFYTHVFLDPISVYYLYFLRVSIVQVR